MRPEDTTGKDNLGKALRRNLSFKRAADLLGRAARSIGEEGWQATYRKAAWRADIALGRDGWSRKWDRPTRKELAGQRAASAAMAQKPVISVVVPLYNTPIPFLRDMIQSVLGQSYPYLELCMADASTEENSPVAAAVAACKDSRIRYKKLEVNGGIAANTNAAAALATGEYLALLDHDDLLCPGALYEMAVAINGTGADFLYSDEIVLSADLKRCKDVHFKPAFAPDYLRGCNYITHLSVFRRALFEALGGENSACDGAQDHDIILRLTEGANMVVHIPKILYIWRAHENSTAGTAQAKPYAVQAGRRAVAAQLERLGMAGTVQALDIPGAYRVTYEVTGTPLVSVLIPNKDHAEDLALCLSSLYEKAGWDNMEVLVVENNSTDRATFAYYEEAKRVYKGLRVITYTGPFNFSAICNTAARAAAGDYLLLLNNDIEVKSEGFVRELLSYAQRADVGAVGAKLLYPDGTVQHAGVVVGIGGSAGHSHKGHPGDSAGNMYRLATTQNFTAVTGACLMVKSALYRELGGLDEENFAVAYNDVDFCLRLWQGGLLNVFTPFALATHYESRSRGYEAGSLREARYNAERDAFREKYAGLMAAGDPYYNPHFTLVTENFAPGDAGFTQGPPAHRRDHEQ